MNDFVCTDKKDYREVAAEENLSDPMKRIYTTFMLDRWGTEEKAYARKWAKRFKRDPLRHMDDGSKEAYLEVLQEEIEYVSSR